MAKKKNTKSARLQLHPAASKLPFDLPGPFVALPGNKLLTVDSHHILTSRDGGKTWLSTPFAPQQSQYWTKDFQISDERVLFRTREGVLVLSFMNINELVFSWNNETKDSGPGVRLPQYVVRSLDNGKTWQDAVCLHEDWTGEIRSIIQLKSGRLVISTQKLVHNPGRHAVVTYVSDDQGKTWAAGNLLELGGCGHHDGVMEATIEQLSDGRVWMLLRTNWDFFWQAFSDDGRWWREIRPSEIDASSSPGQLCRLRSGRLLLAWNRFAQADGKKPEMRGGDGILSEAPSSWMRHELSLAFSEDDGETWSEPVVLASHPGVRLSYPRILEVKPGLVWVTTMQGQLRAQFKESDMLRASQTQAKH